MQASLFTTSPGAFVAGTIFTILLAAACASDVRARRIPNALAASLAVAGLLYSSIAAGSPARGLLGGLAGMGLGLALWLPFYALRWLGAGDVKLFAAAAAWLGPARSIDAAFVAAIAGGVLAVGLMLWNHGLSGSTATAPLAVSSSRRFVSRPVDVQSRRAVPYGVALAIGALAAAWFPNLLTGVLHAHR